MRDFASQGLWPFPDAIFKFFVEELVEDNWGKLVGFRFLVTFDYFKKKKKKKKKKHI